MDRLAVIGIAYASALLLGIGTTMLDFPAGLAFLPLAVALWCGFAWSNTDREFSGIMAVAGSAMLIGGSVPAAIGNPERGIAQAAPAWALGVAAGVAAIAWMAAMIAQQYRGAWLGWCAPLATSALWGGVAWAAGMNDAPLLTLFAIVLACISYWINAWRQGLAGYSWIAPLMPAIVLATAAAGLFMLFVVSLAAAFGDQLSGLEMLVPLGVSVAFIAFAVGPPWLLWRAGQRRFKAGSVQPQAGQQSGRLR